MTQLPPTAVLDQALKEVALSTQYDPSLLGLPRDGVRLTWETSADPSASAPVGYQISTRSRNEWQEHAPVEAPQPLGLLAPGGALSPRERREYRVRVATVEGWSAWSEPVIVEAWLPVQQWGAELIGLDHPVDGPAPILRTTFRLAGKPVRARLYVSFLGLGEVWINGHRAGDEHLAPGWTSYGHRVLVSTIDVADVLVPGENAIAVHLTDGWYRGSFGPARRDRIYGDKTAAILRLEADEFALVSDGSWVGGFGAVRAASLYDGTTIDHTEPTAAEASRATFDLGGFAPVEVVDADLGVFEPRIAAPVRTVAELPATQRSFDGRTQLDVGQNISGWMRLTVRGRAGARVVVRHAEILDPQSQDLYTASLRSAKATDEYILALDGETVVEPVFTFHGFRYADVSGADVIEATAVAISTDLPRRSSFRSDNPALDRFHDNVVWSQRDNFVSVPTDCPQRDERLGWTGDAQAFAATSATLFDAQTFWVSWLRDLELDQTDEDGVPAVVPNIMERDEVKLGDDILNLLGRAGWADAAAIVPLAVYDAYGSDEVLIRQRSSIRRWVEHLRRRAGSGVVLPHDPFQFSDWLDPDAPGDRPWLAKVNEDFVTNAFYARSARLAARVERLLGDQSLADEYDVLADTVAAEAWHRWGSTARETQTGAALALEFGIAPESERSTIGDLLAENVRHERGRIATGFLGTPLVLFALSNTGHLDEAYLMLLRHEAPSWLYQVDRGATTVWERWDAIRPDGSIHTGDFAAGPGEEGVEGTSMVSFNHYAYGAMIDWVYRTVAGIAPAQPGYREVTVAPGPAQDLRMAAASIHTPFGPLSIEWELTDDAMELTLDVPYGSSARLDLPTTSASVVSAADSPLESDILPHGRHRIRITEPAIANSLSAATSRATKS